MNPFLCLDVMGLLTNSRQVREIIPWSIRHMKKTPNISSFHSIPGQLSNPSTNEKQSGRLNTDVIYIANRPIVKIPWLTFPCFIMIRLLICSKSSSICKISMRPFNPRAIRFSEINSIPKKDPFKIDENEEHFPRVFHKNIFLSN